MVVLCDASPLRYLLLIGAADLLSGLYGRIVIPDVVAGELNRPRTPQLVKDWLSQPPGWLEIAVPEHTAAAVFLTELDAGERDAILLALERKADLILMDERDGVQEARRLGLPVVGTVGVLDRAAAKGLVDLKDAFAQLRATNFRVSPSLLERLLEIDATRGQENERSD